MFFTKENILKHTRILLVLLIFHFIWTTFIKFQLWADVGLDFLNSNIINIWKDIYLIFIYIIIFWYFLINKTNIDKKIWGIFIALTMVSFLVSFIHFNWISAIIIGLKYDLWFLFPLLAFSVVKVNKKDIKTFYDLLIKIIKAVIIFSIVFFIIRFTYPQILFLLWYWKLWDWMPWAHPPMFFQTWLDWMQRLSWIFSWPNHMAFYLVAFWPVIFLSILNKKIHLVWGILLIWLLFWSLSRSWILAFGTEFFLISLFILLYYKKYRKIIYYFYGLWAICIMILWSYLYISWAYHDVILRWASTAWHIERSHETIKAIIENPITWHWLWTAWPAAHYVNNDIIPESWILQIFYELWLVWWLLWFTFLLYNIWIVYKSKSINYNDMNKINILKVWLSIWVIGLLVQWLVLHSFEDSMISLPLFIIMWLLIWYIKNNTK